MKKFAVLALLGAAAAGAAAVCVKVIKDRKNNMEADYTECPCEGENPPTEEAEQPAEKHEEQPSEAFYEENEPEVCCGEEAACEEAVSEPAEEPVEGCEACQEEPVKGCEACQEEPVESCEACEEQPVEDEANEETI